MGRKSVRVVVRRANLSHHRCRRCGSGDVARSGLSLLEYVLKMFGRRPYRCLSCNRRFWDRSLEPPR